MTSLASSSGMLLATAQGAVSARMASRLPRQGVLLVHVFVLDAEGAAHQRQVVLDTSPGKSASRPHMCRWQPWYSVA